MNRSFEQRTWRNAGIAAAFALCLVPTASQAADADEIADKLERVERDLRDLQYDVYKGNPPDAGAGVASGSARLNDMERSLRELRGQVETLTFQVKQLTEQLEIARKESNYRLGALEGGAPAGALPAPSASSSAPPATFAPAPPTPAPSSTSGYGGPIVLSPGSNAGGQRPGTLGSLPAGAVPADMAAAQTPRQQYDAAMELLSRAQYPEAQAAFRKFVAANPKDELAGPAQYWVGDIAFTQKDYGGAAKAFADVLKSYAKTARAPDAMLKLGLSLLELGQQKQGCTTLGALKSKYPNANKAILTRAAKKASEAKCR
jgi:tol-pal system protein YbgF